MKEIIQNLKQAHLLLILITGIALSTVTEYLFKSDLEKELYALKETWDSGKINLIKSFRENDIKRDINTFINDAGNYTGNVPVKWNKKELDEIFYKEVLTEELKPTSHFIPTIENIIDSYVKEGITVRSPINLDCRGGRFERDLAQFLKNGNAKGSPEMVDIKLIKESEDSISLEIKIQYRVISHFDPDRERSMVFGLPCACQTRDYRDTLNLDYFNRVFPNIESNLANISGNNFEEAFIYSDQQKNKALSNKNSRILGVDVPKRLIGFSTAILIIMVLVYMISYLKECKNDQEEEDFKHPWIGLMSNPFAMVFNFLTLFLFPALAVFFTINISTKEVWILTLLTIICLLLSVAVYFEHWKLIRSKT